MKKSITILTICIMLLALSVIFTSCKNKCEHTYSADCDEDCNECGEIRETSIEHYYYGDCDAGCHRCFENRKDVAEHSWTPATCTVPEGCDKCGACIGEPLGHEWTTPDVDLCEVQSTCSRCGATDGENKEHTPNDDDGSCLTAITCSDCGTVTTEARTTHEGGAATCLKGKLCDFCGFEYETTTNSENHADKIYTDNGDGSHRVDCQCGLLLEEQEWHSDANMDLYTGKCPCGVFIATVSVTADSVTTYYTLLEDAIIAACSMDNSTVVLLEDEGYLIENIEINSGDLTVELNGKRLDYWKSISGLAINGGSVVIKDSVGEGEVGYIELNSGSLILQSGFFEYIRINGESYVPADILADGYCFYDKDGNVVDISTIQTDEYGWYYLYNVTVGAIE